MSKSEIELTIVIPAYNEEHRLEGTLRSSIDFFRSLEISFQLLVIDDGSTDGTAKLVNSLSEKNSEIELISYPKNEGKGYAVKFGVLNSRGGSILIMDADGSTPISEYHKLKSKLDEGYKVAIGSRALIDKGSEVKTIWYRKLLGRVFNGMVNIILVPGIKDTQCGFKLFAADIAKDIFSRQTINGFAFDCEILYYCQKLGMKIAEVPISWNNVSGSKVNLALHPISMLKDILLVRFKLTN